MPAKDVKGYVERNRTMPPMLKRSARAVGGRRCGLCNQIGRAAGAVDAASRARPFDAAATQLINALRGHMAELGIVAAQGREGVEELVKIIASEQDARMPLYVVRASSRWRQGFRRCRR